MKRFLAIGLILSLFAPVLFAQDEHPEYNFRGGHFRSGIDWPVPPVITPADSPTAPPSDAVILFDGTHADAWDSDAWNVADGVMTVEPRTGDIRTKQKFGSVQLHLEFCTPPVDLDENGTPKEYGQGRGNSGVFFMDHYEVQILDSFDSPTYPDGQCGGIYKQWPPMVNACKAPGQWQYYDIIFTRPLLRIENDEVVEVIRPAYVTVIQNGAVVVNHWEIQGETFYHIPPTYVPHEDAEPIRLQDHGNRMKFRNIWLREIPDANIVPRQSKIQHYE